VGGLCGAERESAYSEKCNCLHALSVGGLCGAERESAYSEKLLLPPRAKCGRVMRS